MGKTYYWIISYRIELLSDIHAGAGVTLLGANIHGIRKDEQRFPFLPHTEVRGLLRLSAQRLASWSRGLKSRPEKNFRPGGMEMSGLWSYTSARYKRDLLYGLDDPAPANILGLQSHIKRIDAGDPRLFSYEKAGGQGEEWRSLWGWIFSIEPSEEEDAALLIASMRAEDRIGHRRSRGYGHVSWDLERVQRYQAGGETEDCTKSIEQWVRLLLEDRGANDEDCHD